MTRLVPVLFLLIFATASLQADVVETQASEDTFITQHPNLGGTSSNHGNDATLQVIGDQNDGYITTSLVRFDLTGLTGLQVNGDATFELYLSSGWPNATVDVSVYESLSNWNESSTWDSMPDGAPYGSVGALQETVSLNYTNQGTGFISWTIAQELVQSWIDDATQNFGLMITSGNATSGHSDMVFSSSEGANAPILTFSVPTPATLSLLGLGLILLSRRRRSQMIR